MQQSNEAQTSGQNYNPYKDKAAQATRAAGEKITNVRGEQVKEGENLLDKANSGLEQAKEKMRQAMPNVDKDGDGQQRGIFTTADEERLKDEELIQAKQRKAREDQLVHEKQDRERAMESDRSLTDKMKEG